MEYLHYGNWQTTYLRPFYLPSFLPSALSSITPPFLLPFSSPFFPFPPPSLFFHSCSPFFSSTKAVSPAPPLNFMCIQKGTASPAYSSKKPHKLSVLLLGNAILPAPRTLSNASPLTDLCQTATTNWCCLYVRLYWRHATRSFAQHCIIHCTLLSMM